VISDHDNPGAFLSLRQHKSTSDHERHRPPPRLLQRPLPRSLA
jgi:hypothetical protein